VAILSSEPHTPQDLTSYKGKLSPAMNNVLDDLVVGRRRGQDHEDAHCEQGPWTPAEHPSVGCLTGWGSAREAASFFLPSPLDCFGPWKPLLDVAVPMRPILALAPPCRLVRREVPVSFGSCPWPARERTAVPHRGCGRHERAAVTGRDHGRVDYLDDTAHHRWANYRPAEHP
jgi:hypothetical protein